MLSQHRAGHNPSTGNYFHHNTVVFDGNSGKTGGSPDDLAYDPDYYGRNRFDNNTYHLPDLSRALFGWNNKWLTFAQFKAASQDTHGSADTNYNGSVPTVAITSPKDGSTVSGLVDLNGNAQDDLPK